MKSTSQVFVPIVSFWFIGFLRALAPLREAILSVAVFASFAHAENWDRFRGPNGAGQSDDTTIPSKWEPENILWKQTLPGIGHSSPVIWGDQLYLTSANATGTQIVSAFDATTGSPKWEKKLDADKYHIHNFNSLASSTPAVDGDALYVLWLTSGQAHLVAFTHNGEELWRHEVGPFQEQHGFGISPIVVDDLVIVARNSERSTDGAIAAFDRKTGEPRWTHALEPGTTAFSTPCLLDPQANPKLLLTTNTTSGLTAIDASCGKVVWKGFKDDLSQRCVSSPFIADGKVFIGCGQGGKGKLLLAVRPGDDKSPPQEAYRVAQNSPQVPTPVVASDLLFVWSDSGIVSCYDVATGEKHWLKRIGGNFHSSPLAIGNRIFGFSRQGEAIVLAADKEFKELARNTLDEPVTATPAVANHRLYVRTTETLFCIGDPTKN